MFMGKFEHALDDKGRFAVPAKLRESIPEGEDRSTFSICRGNDGCLYMYTLRHWKAMDEAQSQINAPVEKIRKRDRLRYASAQKVTADSQGRILLPADLQTLAGITKEIVIVGVRDRIEVWDKKRWQNYESSETESYDQTDNEISNSAMNGSQPKPDKP